MLTFDVTMYGAALFWAAHQPALTSWTLPAAGALFLAVRTLVQPFQVSMRNAPSKVLTGIFVAGAIVHAAAAWTLIIRG